MVKPCFSCFHLEILNSQLCHSVLFRKSGLQPHFCLSPLYQPLLRVLLLITPAWTLRVHHISHNLSSNVRLLSLLSFFFFFNSNSRSTQPSFFSLLLLGCCRKIHDNGPYYKYIISNLNWALNVVNYPFFFFLTP